MLIVQPAHRARRREQLRESENILKEILVNLTQFKPGVVESLAEEELRRRVGSLLQILEMPIQYARVTGGEVLCEPEHVRNAKHSLTELFELLDEGPARKATEKIFAFFVNYPSWEEQTICEADLWLSALRHLLGVTLGKGLLWGSGKCEAET